MCAFSNFDSRLVELSSEYLRRSTDTIQLTLNFVGVIVFLEPDSQPR